MRSLFPALRVLTPNELTRSSGGGNDLGPVHPATDMRSHGRPKVPANALRYESVVRTAMSA
jgi:hypothetical protein